MNLIIMCRVRITKSVSVTLQLKAESIHIIIGLHCYYITVIFIALFIALYRPK